MEATCARAVSIGLPAVAFTEHLDHTRWRLDVPRASDHLKSFAGPDGLVTPPAFDAAGYLEAISRCRSRFPELRILSGLELGEPHRHAAVCADVLAAGQFDRLLGSLHADSDLDFDFDFAEPDLLFARRDAGEVMRDYLTGIAEMVTESDMFSVLAHIDYPVRYWPTDSFEPSAFEEEFRFALRATAGSGRALEVNTTVPLHAIILRWWREEGGDAITFGSDAHQPDKVGAGFADAAAMAEAFGFGAGLFPYELWPRT
jgi:histidinol-phosphatase (PHP family)